MENPEDYNFENTDEFGKPLESWFQNRLNNDKEKVQNFLNILDGTIDEILSISDDLNKYVAEEAHSNDDREIRDLPHILNQIGFVKQQLHNCEKKLNALSGYTENATPKQTEREEVVRMFETAINRYKFLSERFLKIVSGKKIDFIENSKVSESLTKTAQLIQQIIEPTNSKAN